MGSSSWKLLSVQDFLNRYSEAQTDTHVSTTDAIALSHTMWQKCTVQEFFTAYQWSYTDPLAENTEPFGLRLSVHSYFQHFQWNAPLKSLVISAPESPVDPQPSFDVQTFADLF